MEWESGVGFQLFVEGEVDFGFTTAADVDGGDFGAVEEAVGYDVVDLAGLGAEDAGEVGGLIAGEGGGGRGPEVGDEAAAGHLLLLDDIRCYSSEVVRLVSGRAPEGWPGLG